MAPKVDTVVMTGPNPYWLCPFCGTAPLPDLLHRADDAPLPSDPVLYPRNDEHAPDCSFYEPRSQPIPYGTTRL